MGSDVHDLTQPELYAVAMPTLPALLLSATDAVALTVEAAIWAPGLLEVEYVSGFDQDGHPLDDGGQAIPVAPGWTMIYGRTPEQTRILASGHAGHVQQAMASDGQPADELAELWAMAYERLAKTLATNRADVAKTRAAYMASLATAMADLAN